MVFSLIGHRGTFDKHDGNCIQTISTYNGNGQFDYITRYIFAHLRHKSKQRLHSIYQLFG